jgi:hypothetical protein
MLASVSTDQFAPLATAVVTLLTACVTFLSIRERGYSHRRHGPPHDPALSAFPLRPVRQRGDLVDAG